MATVIQEVTIEPKAAPPGEPAAAGSGGGGESGKGPDLEREIAKLARRAKERMARLRAD
ncbi:MAG TPA: hypothetical protein VJ725_18185 [Thermoanaerobaculia bacterium]|nr:hypothetical protein [Thermoanaerobaculia bacterium]